MFGGEHLKELSKDSKVPLYLQLKDLLLEYIEENLIEGDPLPIESQLEEQYGVSRITVRKTIDELVKDGVVVKQQGRGTFVQSKQIVQKAGAITSWTEEMRVKGKQIATKNMSMQEIEPSGKLREVLKLAKNEKVICLKRIRCADGDPISIMINYFRGRFTPGLVERGLSEESLYEVLETVYNIKLEKAHERIHARIATDLEALELGIAPHSALLQISRISYLADGTPFELVEMSNRSDMYQYHIELEGRSKIKTVNPDKE